MRISDWSSDVCSSDLQDAAVATTISFNAADGVALSDAEAAVRQAEADIAMPTSIAGSFEGTARAAKDSQGQQPMLIGLAIVVVYLVLGVLYESYVHPLTVLSTLARTRVVYGQSVS